MLQQTPERSLNALREEFAGFAREQFRGSSPLYERLALAIAGDPELLGLAVEVRPGQPAPLLFLAAVHFLLLSGVPHALAAYYPSVSGTAHREDDPFPAFRAFCHEHREDIRPLLATRLVQTNEVRRCACLLPAFGLVARRAGDRPLTVVEIGASAGLNLWWDRYGYDYGDGRRYGDLRAGVQLTCDLRGDRRPIIPAVFPTVADRVGVDLNPIDPSDAEATRWLRALIWPEHAERADLLQRALEMVRQNPPHLLAGDILDVLPPILAAVPRDTTLCLLHTFALYEFPEDAREQVLALLADEARRRAFFRVSMEWRGAENPLLELVSYANGRQTEERLAWCDTHGAWLHWLGSAAGDGVSGATSPRGPR